jgi:hypothetical protein
MHQGGGSDRQTRCRPSGMRCGLRRYGRIGSPVASAFRACASRRSVASESTPCEAGSASMVSDRAPSLRTLEVVGDLRQTPCLPWRETEAASVMSRLLARQLRRGLPGVYEAVISGHPESPPVRRIRCNEAPEVTGGDSSRQLPITRNEGVPGSSPGVGSPDLQVIRRRGAERPAIHANTVRTRHS